MGGVSCACNELCDKHSTESVPDHGKEYDVANLSTLEDMHQPSLTKEPPPEVTTTDKFEAMAEANAPEVCAHHFDGVVRFQVKLNKDPSSAGGYGLAHAALEGAGVLMVMELRPGGVVSKWNEARLAEGNKGCTIKPGDRIVAMDGAEDLSAMRTMFREQENVSFTVERWPETMKISLKRASPADSFGLNVDTVVKQDGSKSLVVFEVNPGTVYEWNSRVAAAKEFYSIVTPGCELISLNGNSDTTKMTEALLNDLNAELLVRRPELPMPN